MDTSEHAKNILAAINLAQAAGLSEQEQVDAIKLALDAMPSRAPMSFFSDAVLESDVYRRSFMIAGYKEVSMGFAKFIGAMVVLIKKTSEDQPWEMLFSFTNGNGESHIWSTCVLTKDDTNDLVREVLENENQNVRQFVSYRLFILDECEPIK